jgi:hypothetical protein
MRLTETGVLNRHESLAANLGVKLVGPLLLKSFEKLFDGPIRIIQPSPVLGQSIGWHDIVTYARTRPDDFVLSEYSPGGMSCRIYVKGGQVEIFEDDYRLIMSGAPERVIPAQPIAEDEAHELATLNILESRLAILIKKADAVASKARQLNYHLKGRKTAVLNKKVADQQPQAMPELPQDSRTFSPQPYPNMTNRAPTIASADLAKTQQRLLEQFLSGDRAHHATQSSRPKTNRSTIETNAGQHIFTVANSEDGRRMSHPPSSSDDGVEGQYRLLMAAKMEKLARGDVIYPPCDRCRRLGFDCTKNLTACSACTKKHAKCSWKDIREGELGHVPQLPALGQQLRGSVENGYEGSVDPNLRIAHAFGFGGQLEGQNQVGMTGLEGGERGFDGLASDHATLTQIASAAAAAGSR